MQNVKSQLTNLHSKILKIQSLMVQVSTGKANMRSTEREYQYLYRDIQSIFSDLKITNPNPFTSLKDFYGYWSLKLSTYQSRRDYINNMYNAVEIRITNLLDGYITGETVTIPNNLSNIIMINPIFKSRNLALEETLCFVLMPFRPNFNRLYKKIVKPTLASIGFQVLKADDIYTPTPIVEDIWEYINKAQFIIADVTHRNPNVFYELGIAHTIGKKTVILTQDEKDIPFDLRHLRYFKYDDNQEGWEQLKINLKRIANSISQE